MKCLLNLKISSGSNFKFENLTEQIFIRQNLRHVKDLHLCCSCKNKETAEAVSKGIYIGLNFGWLWILMNGGGFFGWWWEIVDIVWMGGGGWQWNFLCGGGCW